MNTAPAAPHPHPPTAQELADATACLAAHAALQQLNTGVAVLSAQRSILFANDTARSLFDAHPEFAGCGQALRLAHPALDERLGRLVSEASGTRRRSSGRGATLPPAAALAILRVGHLPLTLLVAPLRPGWVPGTSSAEPAALVFLRDPEANSAASAAILRSLFDFTATEAVVAGAIAEGRSPQEVAHAHGTTIGTVRTHLKNVMAKTRTCRQAALVALIAGSVASISPYPSFPG